MGEGALEAAHRAYRLAREVLCTARRELVEVVLMPMRMVGRFAGRIGRSASSVWNLLAFRGMTPHGCLDGSV
ncbi:hypothetical protein ADK75_11360 [Streptomyces virginiae]|uniref:Uncharacterized protein n=1 Tax=Streptomyces virginiae TaxID=1961 RepID=A0A0L8MXX6_STRVG|nr:hypothetical protein ADK75_11360 [Streptomyces virginiae]